MRGLWFGLFAVVLIGCVASGQGAGDDLLDQLDAAAEGGDLGEPDPELVRRVMLMDDLFTISREAGQAVTASEVVRYFERGMRPGFWEAGEGGQPTLAALGPVLVVWHTRDGHAELQAFIDDTFGLMRETVDRRRADEEMLKERLMRMHRQHDIPRLLTNYLSLRAVIEGRVVSAQPRERTEEVFQDILALLDEYLELGGGGVVELILGGTPSDR